MPFDCAQDRRFSAISGGYFNIIPNKSQEKRAKRHFFGATLYPIEIRTLSRIISLKCADFLVLTPVYGVRGQAGIVVLGSVWMVEGRGGGIGGCP